MKKVNITLQRKRILVSVSNFNADQITIEKTKIRDVLPEKFYEQTLHQWPFSH